MKKTTKKLIALFCTLVMTLCFITISANAAKVGDVIGYAQPTNIVATINGYQLESYNVDGYTYICVEDLRYYGFNVSYDNDSRSLYVNRDNTVTEIDPQNSNPNFWNIGNNQKKQNILHTDISTYVNGGYIPSCNINGQTIICFDNLSTFGTVSYDNDTREISLLIEDMTFNIIAEFAALLNEGIEYNSDWSLIFRAKGDLLMLLGTARNYMSPDEADYYANNQFYRDKSDAQEIHKIALENGIPVSSVYVEARNSDGSWIASYQTK